VVAAGASGDDHASHGGGRQGTPPERAQYPDALRCQVSMGAREPRRGGAQVGGRPPSQLGKLGLEGDGPGRP
jgi:hypothetical protein